MQEVNPNFVMFYQRSFGFNQHMILIWVVSGYNMSTVAGGLYINATAAYRKQGNDAPNSLLSNSLMKPSY